MEPSIIRELIRIHSGFISENRRLQLEKVLAHRTRHITVVLEDIFQPHNASAVLRSCDCFGIQDVHIIENTNEFTVSPKVALGAAKWLNLYKYNNKQNNTLQAISTLKKEGYRIVATSPHTNETSLNAFDIKGKFALFFGTELTGLSDQVMENADEFLRIPIQGFAESLNISVSAAICLYTLTQKLEESCMGYKLTQNEAETIMLDWLRKTVKSWKSIENRFFKEINQ
ncbi:MAG: TrmH family RNA methyltransferase [Bacteroidales bacterium]